MVSKGDSVYGQQGGQCVWSVRGTVCMVSKEGGSVYGQ